jgi:uncharacterized protein (TIGR02147 family)
MEKIPLVRDYSCYRRFMKDVYQYKRVTRKGFSFRRFSQLVGLKSPNFLQMVMIGKRNMSNDLAPKVAKVMGLAGGEALYFVAMVKKQNAKTEEARISAQRDLTVAVRKIISKEIPLAQTEILTKWYYLVVRELVFLPDFEADAEWVAKKLRGVITEAEASTALKHLLKAGFVQQNSKGLWTVAEPVVDTGDKLLSEKLLQGHLDLMKTWIEVLPSIPLEERELGFLNIPIKADKIPEFKNRIRRFQDEIIGWLQDESDPELIVQLGTYLVPMTTPSKRLER